MYLPERRERKPHIYHRIKTYHPREKRIALEKLRISSPQDPVELSSILTDLTQTVGGTSFNSDEMEQIVQLLSPFISHNQLWNNFLEHFLWSMETVVHIPYNSEFISEKIDELQKLFCVFEAQIPSDATQRFIQKAVLNPDTRAACLSLTALSEPCFQQTWSSLFENITSEEKKIALNQLIATVPFSILRAGYPNFPTDVRDMFLFALVDCYHFSEDVREFAIKIFPQVPRSTLEQIAEICASKKRPDLCTLLFYLAKKIPTAGSTDQPPSLPGRLGNEEIYSIEAGGHKLFFSMDFDHFHRTLSLSNGLAHQILHTIATLPTSSQRPSIAPLCMKYPEPIGYDQNQAPIHADEHGQSFIENFVAESLSTLKNRYRIELEKPSCSIGYFLNQDDLHWSKDPGIKLNSTSVSFSHFTLADWEMPDTSFSGILFQAETNDRYILPLFPHEALSFFSVGPTKGLPHCFLYTPFSPTDFSSHLTSGSTKGKSIYATLQGCTSPAQVEALTKQAIVLNMHTPINYANGREYAHNITFKSIEQIVHTEALLRHIKSVENCDVYAYCKDDLRGLAKEVQTLFPHAKPVKAFRIVKKTAGFSDCHDLLPDIPQDATLIVLNRTQYLSGYAPYPLAKSLIAQGTPLIQLFHFPKNEAMLVTGTTFQALSLTSIIELFFRQITHTSPLQHPAPPQEKIVTELDVIVLEPSIITVNST